MYYLRFIARLKPVICGKMLAREYFNFNLAGKITKKAKKNKWKKTKIVKNGFKKTKKKLTVSPTCSKSLSLSHLGTRAVLARSAPPLPSSFSLFSRLFTSMTDHQADASMASAPAPGDC